MVEDNRPPGGSGGDPPDYHYFGPFGPERGDAPAPGVPDAEHTRPLGIGDWRSDTAGEPTPMLRNSPRFSYGQPVSPSAAGTTTADQLFPAPGGVPPLQPRPPDGRVPHYPAPAYPVNYPPPAASPPGQRRPMRTAAVIAVSALTAVVIGGTAGYGGAKLADRPLTSGPISPTTGPSAMPTAAPTTAPTRTPVPPAPSEVNTVEVAKLVVPSTVMIQVGSGTSSGTGSGFVLDTQGRIMTNNHVVARAGDGGRIQVVFSDGTTAPATVLGRSPSYDLAVIKVKPSAALKPLTIGDSDASQVGETVIAVGSPLGLPGTVTEGIVSAKNRPVVVGDAASASAYINGIQTDAPINPGNSGGPLVDGGGRVIGVNSAILTLGQSRGQSGSIGLGFAIPINQAAVIGDLLIKYGKATYPVIGANVESRAGQPGVTLSLVENNGPAEKAGLRKGDLVTGIDGQAVDEIEELIVAIRTHRPGDEIKLAYTRGGVKKQATVTLTGKEG
jgi:putative serine protease PepD